MYPSFAFCKHHSLFYSHYKDYFHIFIVTLLSVLCFDIHEYFLLSSHSDKRQNFVHPQSSLMSQTLFTNFQTEQTS